MLITHPANQQFLEQIKLSSSRQFDDYQLLLSHIYNGSPRRHISDSMLVSVVVFDVFVLFPSWVVGILL